MKALTLTQPWASLVAAGVKLIETRSWGTDYRGPIAIHAAKSFKREDHGTIYSGRPGLLELCARHEYAYPLEVMRLAPSTLPMGAIVAVAELVDVVRHHTDGRLPDQVVSRFTISPYERKLGGYGPGRVYWLLKDVQRVEPVTFRGALYLQNVPDDMRERLAA